VGAEALRPWNVELAGVGLELAVDRRQATERIAERFASYAETLGLDGTVRLSYRARSQAGDVETLAEEIAAALPSDLARGYSTHGPHRDDLTVRRDGRDLRGYGSQGEQRVALLALLIAERDALAAERDRVPLMLFDDVMSELDGAHRERLADALVKHGQTVVTTTDLEHVPGWDGEDVKHVDVEALTSATSGPLTR
jgi:DNA replication and repair protein RecF